MVINRNVIELGDLFEFQTQLVRVVDIEKLPIQVGGFEEWRNSILHSNVSVEFIGTDRILATKVETLKPISLWIPSADFTKAIGFIDFEYAKLPLFQAHKLMDILLFRILYLDDEGYTVGTEYTIGHTDDIDRIEKFHNEMNNPGIREQFEKEFTPISNLNVLLSGLRAALVSYDIKSIKDHFYDVYIPAKLDWKSL